MTGLARQGIRTRSSRGSRRRSREQPREDEPSQRAQLPSLTGGIFAGALLLRLLFVWSVKDQTFFSELQTEPLRYFRWASAIADGQWPLSLPLDAGPGYPLFVALVFAVAGPSVSAVAYVQAAMDAGSSVFAALVMVRLVSPKAGLVTGIVWAAFGPGIYYSAQLLPVTPLLFSLWGAVHFAEQPPEWPARRRALSWIASGVFLAGAVAVRTEAVLVVPWFLLRAWRTLGGRTMAVAALPVLLYAGTMTALNHAASSRVVPLTVGGGFNLWLANHPEGDGVNPFLTPTQQRRAAELQVSSSSDPVVTDRAFAREAARNAAAQPARSLALLGKKLLWFFHSRELPNTSDIDWERGHSWLFRFPLLPLGFGLLVPLAFVGAVAGRRNPGLWWIWATAAVAAVTSLLFFSDSRFRALVHPSLVALAALGILALPGLLQGVRARTPAAIGAVLFAALGLGLSNGNWLGVRTYRIPQLDFNTGLLEERTGNHREAVQRFRSSAEAAPWDAPAWLHLAQVLYNRGCFEQAERALREGASRSGSVEPFAGPLRLTLQRRTSGQPLGEDCQVLASR